MHTLFRILKINSSSDVEHEATTSKISDDQLFYCRQEDLIRKSCKLNCKWFLRSIATITYGICC